MELNKKTFKMYNTCVVWKKSLYKNCCQQFVRNRKIVGNNFYTRLCLLAMVCCSEYVLRRVSVVQLTITWENHKLDKVKGREGGRKIYGHELG